MYHILVFGIYGYFVSFVWIEIVEHFDLAYGLLEMSIAMIIERYSGSRGSYFYDKGKIKNNSS